MAGAVTVGRSGFDGSFCYTVSIPRPFGAGSAGAHMTSGGAESCSRPSSAVDESRAIGWENGLRRDAGLTL